MLWSSAASAQFTLTLQPNTLPAATENVPYNQTVTAVGGNAPYTFAVTSGSLPPGLSLASNGNITGTPNTPGTYPVTFQATDSGGNTGFRPYTFKLGTQGGISLSPGSPLPPGSQGVAYSQTITASGGSGSGRSFSISSGSLPPGLSINSGTGVISGTPTTGGTSNFTVAVIDDGGNTGSQAYALSIGGNILTFNPSTLPNGTQGTPYSRTVSATGGTGPYTFAISGGSLPTSLSMDSAGNITGTPSAAGSYSFTVRATDSVNNVGTRTYNVTIGSNILTVNPATLPGGTTATPYNQTVTATGGVGGYSFAVSAGSLPTGLSLAAGGAITGTPSAAGSYSFTVTATDSNANTGSRAYTVNIGLAPLTINPATLPAGTQGTAYSRTIVASGGVAPYSYSLISGSLPPGLTLNAGTGVLSGTPSAGGAYSFTVQATDAQPNTGTRAYTLNIGTNSLTINPSTLPAAVAGHAYSATVSATGGTGPYTYSVVGSMPAGLTLNSTTGVISGTLTALGASSFTIRALDANGNTGSRAYTLVNRPDPALDPEVIGLVNAQVATARRFALAQVDNVSRHLEGLHSGFNPCSVDFGVGLPRSPDDGRSPYGAYSPYSPSPGNAARSYEPNSPASEIARRSPDSRECAEGYAAEVAAWVSGSVQFGQQTPDSTIANNKFTTSGLTAGIDWHAMDNLVVGFAVGFGADSTSVGVNGSQSSASSLSGTAYASWKPYESWFVDAALGFGGLGYDNKRYVADDNTVVNGSRRGTSWFGAISTGYEVRYGALRLSPYVRADFMSAQLNAYNEHGGSAELLTYNAMTFHSLGGTVGLRGSYDVPMSWGTLTPIARAEYRQALDSSFNQAMYYTDIGSTLTSTLAQGATSRGTVTGTLGLRARALNGMSGEVEYGTASGSGGLQAQTVRAAVKMAF